MAVLLIISSYLALTSNVGYPHNQMRPATLRLVSEHVVSVTFRFRPYKRVRHFSAREPVLTAHAATVIDQPLQTSLPVFVAYHLCIPLGNLIWPNATATQGVLPEPSADISLYQSIIEKH